MRHRPPDLATQIERATLPRGLEGFLFPLFEAVTNSLHSIEDRFGDDAQQKGSIRIVFDQDQKRIDVVDNGEGFTRANTEHFLTPFTGHKLKRNGKGFGRFISFKIFDEVLYSSPTEELDGSFHSAIYEYRPIDPEDNLVPLEDTDRIARHVHDRGLSVSFRNPKDEHLKFFDFTSEEADEEYTELSIVTAILDHFLLQFIQNKVPTIFLLEIGGVPFNLSEYFSSSILGKGTRLVPIEIEGEEESFEFTFMQIDADKAKQHDLYFYADNRATSDLEHISKGLKETAFQDDDGRKYFYLVAVTSQYFRPSQSRDRIENLNVKVGEGRRSQALKKVLAQSAKDIILELEPAYTKKRRDIIRKNLQEILVLDPILRRGLGKSTIEEFVSSRGILESKEQLASDLFIERQRVKFDFAKVNSTMPYEELQRVVRDNIRDEAKEALAVYVAYRTNVIKVLIEMLNRRDGKVAKEDAVHELVYPRYKDSEEIDYEGHNLWLIDDDLAYAEYVSSDRTTTGTKRRAGDYAHDLLINSEEELLIVEMKRPLKSRFDNSEDAKHPTDNPVQQVKDQVAQIRERGFIKTSGDRKITINKDRMVRAYILMDWNDKVEAYLKREEFVLSNLGGPMAYRYFPWHNMMIEVLDFGRLADRAAKRNEVFENILKGNADQSGRKVSDPLLVEVKTATN